MPRLLALTLLVPALATAQTSDADTTLAPTGDEVYEVVGVQPELIGGLEALHARVVYPESARRDGIEGQVVVQFVVDEEGAVANPVVLQSPDELLAEAALDAVVGSRFTPGRHRGEPVKVRFAVPVTFRLTDPEPEAPEVYDVVEEMPQLVGGLRGLTERLEYPEDARRDGVQGQVFIEFILDEEGRVTDPVVTRSPDRRLSRAALDALLASRFTPGRIDGRPVRVRFALPIAFRLREAHPRRVPRRFR